MGEAREEGEGRKMKTMFKLSLTLAAYAVVACVGLAFVYNATAPIIEASAANEVKGALKVLFPEASDFTDVSSEFGGPAGSIGFDRAFVAVSGDAPIGMIVQATGPTYKSSTLLVAVDMNRTVTKVQFTANTDTPGLGTKTAESPFIDQFFGKKTDDEFKTGSDVTAISGATISSKAVAAIIKAAAWQAGDYLAKNHGAAAGSGSAPVVAELAPFTLEAGLAELFPECSFEQLPSDAIANSVERSVVLSEAWLARSSDGSAAGVGIVAKGQTYKASTLLVGVLPDATLAGLRVLATTDSANYGKEMLSPDFYSLFAGKSVADAYLVKPSVPEGDIDSISGATISTQGVANMLKIAAYEGSRYLRSAHGGKAASFAEDPFILNVIPEQE